MHTMKKNLVFIDNRVVGYQSLLASLGPDTDWYVLTPDEDGLTQMLRLLNGYHSLDAIQIISHGAPGALFLGSASLTVDDLAAYAGALSTLGASVTETGDLLLYGCDVGQGSIGQAFITHLAQATGADVSASDDPTGSASLGGDWVLERSTGPVEAAALSAAGYAALLDTFDGTVGADSLTL